MLKLENGKFDKTVIKSNLFIPTYKITLAEMKSTINCESHLLLFNILQLCIYITRSIFFIFTTKIIQYELCVSTPFPI